MNRCVCFCRPAVLCALAGSAVVAAASPAGASGSFLPLGVLDASTQYPLSLGVGMTPDGQTVVGYSNADYTDNIGTTLSYGRAFRWTQAGGMVQLGVPNPFLAGTAASRVSADGSVIVGTTGFSLEGNYEARNGAFWTDANTSSATAHAVEQAYFINDVSRDGGTLIGTTRLQGVPFPILNQAFVWQHESGSLTELGTLPGGSYSQGLAASGDGSIIVGSGDSDAGFIQAWRWTESGGMHTIPGVSDSAPSEAFDISADGHTIVGVTGNAVFRWNDSQGMTTIPSPANSFVLQGMDIRADGDMLVGTFNLEDGSFQPFIWSEELGTRELSMFLTDDMGIDLGGYTLLTASAISDDGTRIAGVAISPSGIPEAYLITIPSPGAGVLALGTLAAGRRRRR